MGFGKTKSLNCVLRGTYIFAEDANIGTLAFTIANNLRPLSASISEKVLDSGTLPSASIRVRKSCKNRADICLKAVYPDYSDYVMVKIEVLQPPSILMSAWCILSCFLLGVGALVGVVIGVRYGLQEGMGPFSVIPVILFGFGGMVPGALLMFTIFIPLSICDHVFFGISPLVNQVSEVVTETIHDLNGRKI